MSCKLALCEPRFLVFTILVGLCSSGLSGVEAFAQQRLFASAADVHSIVPYASEFSSTQYFPDIIKPRTLMILTVGGAAAALSWNDKDTPAMQRTMNNSFLNSTTAFGNLYGSGWVVGGGSLTILAAGQLAGDDKLKSFGSDLCRSFLITAAVTNVIKYSVNRTRPSGGNLSFPSGHTAVAFSTVPVIAHHLGWQAGLTVTMVATFTGMARIAGQHHYLSDVLFGAAIGLAVGDEVIQWRQRHSILGGVTVSAEHVGYSVRF